MKKFFFVMILIIGLQACKSNVVADFELTVLDEIFYYLIERMEATHHLQPPPPLPKLEDTELDSAKYQIFLNEYQEFIDKFEEIQNKVQNNETTIVIAVLDTLITCYKFHEKIKPKLQLIEHGYNEALNTMADSSIVSRSLDLSKIKNTKNFTLRYYSEFPEDMRIWEREKYEFLFSGILVISRIYFDTSNKFGLIYSSFVQEPLWGHGAIVCIRKIADRWIIEEVIELWGV